MGLDVAIRHRLGAFDLDVAFKAPHGVTALFGPSGAGKTTVINAVAGLVAPNEGRIVIDGATVLDTDAGLALVPHRRRIGVVFQDARLFPHLTVRQNLTFGRWFSALPSDAGELASIVDLLGLGHVLERRPARLSGGEKQRVAIGRALLAKPRLLLMDEPLAALDAARKAEILPYLERLRTTLDIPVLYVSHAIEEVYRLATTVVRLEAGRVVAQGSPAEVLSKPAHASWGQAMATGRQLAGRLSCLMAQVAGQPGDAGLIEVRLATHPLYVTPPTDAIGETVKLIVSPEAVILTLADGSMTSARNVLPVTVVSIDPAQDGCVCVGLSCDGQPLEAVVPSDAPDRLGLSVGAACTAILINLSVSP